MKIILCFILSYDRETEPGSDVRIRFDCRLLLVSKGNADNRSNSISVNFIYTASVTLSMFTIVFGTEVASLNLV